MKKDNQGALWWTDLRSNSDRNENEKLASTVKTESAEEKTREILDSYRRMMEKNTELMQLLMSSFKAQAEKLDKLLIV